MTAPRLALHEASLRFGGGTLALDRLSLQVEPGEFVALLGPSGCGKSTVLRLLAGLLAPTQGRREAPADARMAFVFQEPTLMPWASVADNVRLPLRLQGRSRASTAAEVDAVLQAVGLGGFAQAYPAQLSGGMKMRASIARALVTQPQVLLMDEPFAALDDLTRQKLHADLMDWWQRLRPATVFVTHNVAEAVRLSHRVLVMSPRPGRVVAEHRLPAGAPRDAAWRVSEAYFAQVRAVSLSLQEALG
jgi:NitT/TauT family transport system ATP-binding protein